MTTLTYCKGLPTPIDELNPIGFTELEMLLTAYSSISHQATSETVNHLLTSTDKFDQRCDSLEMNHGIQPVNNSPRLASRHEAL
jgi:hypothetical protein